MAVTRGTVLGYAVAATGVIHLAFGLVNFGPPLRAMVDAGLVNSMGGAADRQATLWYFVAGGFLLTAGLTIRWADRLIGRVPPPMAWGLLVIAVLGVTIAPASGFWLVLVEGVLLVLATRKAARDPVSRSAAES